MALLFEPTETGTDMMTESFIMKACIDDGGYMSHASDKVEEEPDHEHAGKATDHRQSEGLPFQIRFKNNKTINTLTKQKHV